MKVLFYCQHVLGIGHLHRALALCQGLAGHHVLLVLGGPPLDLDLPAHVRVARLPGLRMDEDFGALHPVEPGADLDEVRARRTRMLLELARDFGPDAVLVELYPFGRNAFHFELAPLLDSLCGQAVVACSVRDILVEKENQARFERRVLERLDRWFDLVLVHGDPRVIPFEATFPPARDLAVPLRYTGYVARAPRPGAGQALRRDLGLGPEESLAVVSAGGGAVGRDLVEAAIRAQGLVEGLRMRVFTGPYMPGLEELRGLAGPGCQVERFSSAFPAWLDAADLSISMAGYNTCMNLLAAGTPGLLLPFDQNREQALRLERLAGRSALRALVPEDLEPARLARLVRRALGRPRQAADVDLHGAERTAALLEEAVRGRAGR